MDYLRLKAENAAINHEEVLSGALALKSRPLFFWFDLCGPCNLKCTHCAYRIHGRSSEQDVSEAVYAAVLAELMPNAYICHLGGTNYGEMTISKHFHRFLNDCKAFQVRINLTTNGTRMHDDWIDDLMDSLAVIGFSMEGMGEQFEKIRGFKWRSFLKHVEKICRGRADRGKSFRVEWRYCAHADNVHQLPDLIRLARSIGVDRIQVMDLVAYLENQRYKRLSYHRSLANQYFAEARRVAEELQFDINIPPDFGTGSFEPDIVQIGRPARAPLIQTTRVELPTCHRPWQFCSINELGVVKPDDIYWRPAGDLSKSSFESIWNGWKYRLLRARVNRRPDSICYSCRMPLDSADSRAETQSKPGLREMLRSAVTVRRRHFEFIEVPDHDLRDIKEPEDRSPGGGQSGPPRPGEEGRPGLGIPEVLGAATVDPA